MMKGIDHPYLHTRVHVANPLKAELLRLQATRQDNKEQVEIALQAMPSAMQVENVLGTHNGEPACDEVNDVVERLKQQPALSC